MTAFEWIVAVFALFGLFAFLVTVAGIIAGLCSGKQPRQRFNDDGLGRASRPRRYEP